MNSSVKERPVGARVAGSSLMARAIVLALLLGAVVGLFYLTGSQGGNVLTDRLSAPLSGATSANVNLNPGDGNLTVARLTGGEQLLASGMLQYAEGQGVPTRSMNVTNGQAILTLRGGQGGQPWFSFPWAACNGATEWQVRLNPNVQTDLTAHTDGGNVILNLDGMAVSQVSADTGGGNMEVVLPDNAADLKVKAGTGAGNVVVRVPSGMAAEVHATSGIGKVAVDPRFSKVGSNTYRSSDYESATNKVEITASSGAGNVNVETK